MDIDFWLMSVIPGDSRNVLVEYIRKCSAESGQCLYECSLCGHQNSLRTNVLNHVESQHFPNTFVYLCPFCKAEFHSKNARNVHISRQHRGDKYQKC